MAESPKVDVLSGLKLNNFYKYFLYVFGVILILSMFWGSYGLDVNVLRGVSVTIIIICSFVWFLDNIIGKAFDYYRDRFHERGDNSAIEKAKALWVFNYFIYFISLILIAFQLYSLV